MHAATTTHGCIVLLDHLVGAREHGRRHGEVERLCRLQVDDQFILSGCLHRQVAGLLALEDAIYVSRRASELVGEVRPIRNQAAARIGIVPTRQGSSDKVRRDEHKNLVICPLHHDQDFMQTFYEGWRIVQALIESDAQMPNEVLLPHPVHREVARILVERREFPVLDVVAAIATFSQPELLETDDKQVETTTLKGQSNADLVVAPISNIQPKLL